jgi:hypothetical protein
MTRDIFQNKITILVGGFPGEFEENLGTTKFGGLRFKFFSSEIGSSNKIFPRLLVL